MPASSKDADVLGSRLRRVRGMFQEERHRVGFIMAVNPMMRATEVMDLFPTLPFAAAAVLAKKTKGRRSDVITRLQQGLHSLLELPVRPVRDRFGRSGGDPGSMATWAEQVKEKLGEDAVKVSTLLTCPPPPHLQSIITLFYLCIVRVQTPETLEEWTQVPPEHANLAFRHAWRASSSGTFKMIDEVFVSFKTVQAVIYNIARILYVQGRGKWARCVHV